ncbi:MAG: hypothetical protein ACRDDF_06435, partial [Aeromonas sp.]
KLAIIENWLSINAMELNPSKCGIMEIDTDPYCPQMEPILYNGELIPSIDRYVYLGTEINKSLNLTEMAKYRLNKGRQTLIQLRTTLINERIPIEYRIMLIKSILIPRCMFGAEIFGMSEKRVDPIKRILDNAFLKDRTSVGLEPTRNSILNHCTCKWPATEHGVFSNGENQEA